MYLRIKLEPFSIVERHCCLKWAIDNGSVLPTTYGTYGSYRSEYSNENYAIVYDAEVKKRKKHRGHLTTTIRKYRIPLEVLRLMNCKVVQYPRYFRIIPNK